MDYTIIKLTEPAPPKPTRNDHGLADCLRCANGKSNGKRVSCSAGHFGLQESFSLASVNIYGYLRQKYCWCVDYQERVKAVGEKVVVDNRASKL